MNRQDLGIPETPVCADCGIDLMEPFGWCGNCAAAYCLACGRAHFCRPECAASGCYAGLCVRLVRGGHLSAKWGLPTDELAAATEGKAP